MQKAYPIVIRGLINANRGKNAHWSTAVNTVTMQVVRTYMEMNRETFEKLSSNNTTEEAKRELKDTNLANSWAALERKYYNR